jgi:hypothetical protein
MLRELGAKRTPTDPTGSKHRLGFVAFCLAMLVLIAALVIWADGAEAAAPVCRGPVSVTNTTGTYSVTLTTNRWCGARDSQGTWRFTSPVPNFDRTYSEGPIWDFNRWFASASQIGIATAPNGTAHVAYVARWVAAEFKLCTGVPGTPTHVCYHSTDGARIWTWANGNYTLNDGPAGVPRLPMPRP